MSYEYYVWVEECTTNFQLTMTKVFRSLLDNYIIIYLDDILVYSKTWGQHLKDLEAVFALYGQHRLITKGSKCEFSKEELGFLGHFISNEGIEIDPKKIDTFRNWESLTNVKNLKSFLEFINYALTTQ
ncbi:hypothetical protein CLOM_g11203 [Closterium sp. NIES-68]|nr:hypothetical protein CLOM_g11203 [Closterium sp. NIES-68]